MISPRASCKKPRHRFGGTAPCSAAQNQWTASLGVTPPLLNELSSRNKGRLRLEASIPKPRRILVARIWNGTSAIQRRLQINSGRGTGRIRRKILVDQRGSSDWIGHGTIDKTEGNAPNETHNDDELTHSKLPDKGPKSRSWGRC